MRVKIGQTRSGHAQEATIVLKPHITPDQVMRFLIANIPVEWIAKT